MANTLKHKHRSNSDSLFFNCKKTFCVVLVALIDANDKFAIIDFWWIRQIQ